MKNGSMLVDLSLASQQLKKNLAAKDCLIRVM